MIRRAWGFALAAGLYGALILGLLASPVFMLELMKPPQADVKERDPRDRLIFQPRRPKSGDGLRVPQVRSGVRNGKGSSARPRSRPVRAVASVAPLAEPPTPIEWTRQPPPDDDVPGDGNPREGDPDGKEDGQKRGNRDSNCLDCTGTERPGNDEDGPFGPSTPGLIPPRIIPSSRALPQYPAAARRAGLLGTVILMIVVEVDGSVGQIEVLRSPDQRWGFDLSAIDAVKQWRYEPALMNGKAVAAYITVMVEFTLSR
jgi:protein TonB